MFERFTERARQVVVLAQEEARTAKHNYIGTEHILLGILREEEGLGARALESFDITVERARAWVIKQIGAGEDEISGQIPFTPRAKKVLELALREALSLGHNYIGTEHILLGLVRENEGVAARYLREDAEVSAVQIRDEVIRMLRGPSGKRQQSDEITDAQEKKAALVEAFDSQWVAEVDGFPRGGWANKPSWSIENSILTVVGDQEEPVLLLPVSPGVMVIIKKRNEDI